MRLNRAIALTKLGRHSDAREAWNEVKKDGRTIPDDEIPGDSTQRRNQDWIGYWFQSPTAKIRRRILGVILLSLLGAVVILPMVDNSELSAKLSWIQSGQAWQFMIVPAAILGILLLLPTTRITLFNSRFEPIPDPATGDQPVPRPPLHTPPPVTSADDMRPVRSPYSKQRIEDGDSYE